MIRHFILTVFLFLGIAVFAQSYPPFRRRSNTRGAGSDVVSFVGQIGVAAGQEHFISAPKGGVFLNMGLGYPRRSRYKKMEWDSFSDIGFHVGLQLSVFVLFGGWFSYGFQGGISLKPFTFDVSITRTIIQSPGSEIVGRDNTFNPKLGVYVGPVWIQAGPSFAMNGKQTNYNNLIEIGGRPFNFEVSYIIEL